MLVYFLLLLDLLEVDGLKVDYGSIRKTSSWEGSASSDWETPANWDNNALPTSESIVNIPASRETNEPTVSSRTGVAAYDLTINAARTLTVEGGDRKWYFCRKCNL